jgi:hypothetical protein
MKKLIVLIIALALLATSFGSALASPRNNPHGYWIEDVRCEHGTFDVWVPNDYANASFNETGGVGVMKALYINFGNGYVLIWQVPGNGVFKNTTYCEWDMPDGMKLAGEVLIP